MTSADAADGRAAGRPVESCTARVQEHDAGVASAMLNTTQQIGGSLGTALLNTLYASTLVSYLSTHAASLHNPGQLMSLATISGYRRTFLIRAIFMAAASIAITVLVNAHKSESTTPQGDQRTARHQSPLGPTR